MDTPHHMMTLYMSHFSFITYTTGFTQPPLKKNNDAEETQQSVIGLHRLRL